MVFRVIMVGLAHIFPKFKHGYGVFFIIFMHLVALFCLFAAWADYGSQPASVIRFEIYLAIGSSLTGWVLGIALIRQAQKHRKILDQHLESNVSSMKKDKLKQ